MEGRITRRKFDTALAYGLGSLLLPDTNLFSPETKETDTSVFSRFGLHTIPDINAAGQIDITIKDLLLLSGDKQRKVMTIISPNFYSLQKIKVAGITPIIRPHLPENKYNRALMMDALDMCRAVGIVPIINQGCEVNVETMTNPTNGEKEIINPGAYIRDHWIFAARDVVGRGGIILTPTYAQDAPVNDLDHLPGVLQEIKKRVKDIYNWDDKHLWIGVHNYTYLPGEDPFKRIRKINEIVTKYYGKPLPIGITEAGIAERAYKFTPEEIAKETIRILNLPIPEDLDIRFMNWWVHANRGLRVIPEEVEDANKDDFDRWDKMAFRSDPYNVNPIFNSVAELAQSKNPGKILRRNIIFPKKAA